MYRNTVQTARGKSTQTTIKQAITITKIAYYDLLIKKIIQSILFMMSQKEISQLN